MNLNYKLTWFSSESKFVASLKVRMFQKLISDSQIMSHPISIREERFCGYICGPLH